METNFSNIKLYNSDETLPSLPSDIYLRDNYIDIIQKKLNTCDVLFLKGEAGIGKTTILASFVNETSINAISHFISVSDMFTYTPFYFKQNIANQIQFYATDKCEYKEIMEIDDTFSPLQSALRRKIRNSCKSNNPLYFIFDGLNEISKVERDHLVRIIHNLPFKLAKFIFSCDDDEIELCLPKGLNYTYLDVTKFTIIETEHYLSDLEASKEQYKELYLISHKGLPEKLSQIKRLCKEVGDINDFLETVNYNTDLFEVEWKNIQTESELLIAFLAHNNEIFNIKGVSEILDFTINWIKDQLETIKFIELDDNEDLKFLSNSHRNFAKEKTKKYEEKVWALIIDHYEKNVSEEESIFNLPNLYLKAKKWKELTKLLSLNAFITVVDRFKSISNVKRQLDYGLEAAKHINVNNEHVGDILRFALHKSSFFEMEKFESWENEVEARIALHKYDEAILIANSALLKEDRLKMLSIIAKHLKLSGKINQGICDQIKELYPQIEFHEIREKGFEIANLLMYFDFPLALNLMEQVLDRNTQDNSVDFAYAYLSFYAFSANKQANSKLIDIDLISAKIKDSNTRAFSTSLDFLTEECNVETIIEKANKIQNANSKIFLLRYWIVNNLTVKNIETVIEYCLNEIISSSNENIPNASVLSDIAKPIPLIPNFQVILDLITLFDSQKNTINTPTRDFIQLQLTIAEALYKFNKSKALDRIFEVWFIIEEEIKDLSIKTDCLTLLWDKFLLIDEDNSIEKSIFPSGSIEDQIKLNLKELLSKTAYHFRMVEFIIEKMVVKKPRFILELINKINTFERRQAAFELASINYINGTKADEIEPTIIQEFYNAVLIDKKRTKIIISLLEKYDTIKDAGDLRLLLLFKNEICNIKSLSKICYALTVFLKILFRNKTIYSSLVDEIYSRLIGHWKSIDNQVQKVQVGFLISKNLASSDNEKANDFLEMTIKFKDQSPFASSSIMQVYYLNAKLVIKAFEGIALLKNDFHEELNKIDEIIDLIPSKSDKIKLWSSLALVLRSANKISEFSKIVIEKVDPLINEISLLDSNLKISIFKIISPTLFFSSQSAFLFNIDSFSGDVKDEIISNVCHYIFYKKEIDEPVSKKEKGVELSYASYIELCNLLKECENDNLIYSYVRKISINLEKNAGKLITTEMKNLIISELNKIIDSKLPNKSKGVDHNGYLILSKASLLIHKDYYKCRTEWDSLFNEARSLNNISDKSLVLVVLVELLEDRIKKQYRIDLLEEAFNFIRRIPSNYDKTNRFDTTWSVWLAIEKGQFEKHIRLAYNELINDKDGALGNIKEIIDIAHQHNSKLAEELVTILDQEPSRQKLKDPLLLRLKSKEKIKKASDELENLKQLTENEFHELFDSKLGNLNSGSIAYTPLNKTYNILEVTAEIPLSKSFGSLKFFIQNEIQRMNPDLNLILSFFEATYQNGKLIATFSTDNIEQMKHLFKYSQSEISLINPIFRYGERQKFLQFLSSWILKNIENEIFIIDPYFEPNQVDIVKLIKENKPKARITILTSNNKKPLNDSVNFDTYCQDWKSIFQNNIPDNRIIYVADSSNYDCPFHDRWILGDELKSGLILNSLNSLGNKKDTQIIEMDDSALKNIESIVFDYIYHKKSRIKGYDLNYLEFTIK